MFYFVEVTYSWYALCLGVDLIERGHRWVVSDSFKGDLAGVGSMILEVT